MMLPLLRAIIEGTTAKVLMGAPAGAVHEHVDLAESVEPLLHQPLDLLVIAEVGHDRQHLRAELFALFHHLVQRILPFPRNEYQVRAFSGERDRDGLAVVAPRASDQRSLACQLSHEVLLMTIHAAYHLRAVHGRDPPPNDKAGINTDQVRHSTL
jgi:hypothetical protein